MFKQFTSRLSMAEAAIFALIVLFGFGLTAASAAQIIFVPPHAPVVTIKAHPKHVKVGGSSTIIWSAQFATHGCTQTGDWSGQNEGVGGTYVTGPLSAGEHTYTLLCAGDQNRRGSGSVTVFAGKSVGSDDKNESSKDNATAAAPTAKPVCEYARPPAGCNWVGMQPFPNCSAAHLVCSGTGSVQ